MNQKVLLLGLCTLCVATIVGCFWFANADADGPPGPEAAPGQTDASAAQLETTASNLPTVAEASADPATAAAARDAVADAKGKRPIPEDATWVTVTVVDDATKRPVPNATVAWHDEKAWETLTPRSQRRQWNPELQQLWRQPERVAELAGWTTRTDADGKARVSVVEHTTLAALHEGRYGELRLRKNTVAPAGGNEVRLFDDRTLRACVLDAEEQPCRGIPIQVVPMLKDKEVGNFRWMTLAHTGDDGIATLPHVQHLRKQAADENLDLARLEWFVKAVQPGDDSRGVSVSIETPPAEPVVLRLQPGGTIKVRATQGGKPMASFERAQLQEDRSGKGDEHQWWTPRIADVEADGFARFHHVPLHHRYHVSDANGAGLRKTVPGPVARGQEVEVVLQLADETIALTGRIVGVDRQPVAQRQFTVQARGPAIRQLWSEFQTDADGRFFASIGRSRKDNRVDELWFDLVADREERPLRASLTPRTLRIGVEDVGDVVLEPAPLLVAGTVLTGDVLFKKPLGIEVEVQEPPTGNRPPRWRSLEFLQTFFDGKGAFEVRGKPGNGLHRLKVHPNETLPTQPIDFTVGAKDVVVHLETGAPLAASLLAPNQLGWDTLRAVLVPAKPPTPDDKRNAQRLTAHPDNGQHERYDLQWSAVPHGTYALELHLQTRREPLLRIDGIAVPGPEGGDPRLVDIDLRGNLRRIVVHLLDATGQPMKDANGLLLANGRPEAEEWTAQQFWEPKFTTLVANGPLDLLLCTQGFQPQSIRNAPTGDLLEVRLDAWPQVNVTVADAPRLPDGVELHAQLVPSAGPTGRVRMQWGNMDRADYLTANGSCEVKNGTAKVAIGDGAHTLKLALVANNRRHELTGVTPEQVLPTAADVVARVPQDQWQAGIAAVAKPAK